MTVRVLMQQRREWWGVARLLPKTAMMMLLIRIGRQGKEDHFLHLPLQYASIQVPIVRIAEEANMKVTVKYNSDMMRRRSNCSQ